MTDLHVVKQGAGPMVVLSHALGCDLTMWDEVADFLQSRYTVLRYDPCGHGLSLPQAGHTYTVEAYADEAAELIAQHSEGPVTFVGLVMGGMVGQQLAVRHPQWVRRLVMANAAAFFAESVRADLGARMEQVRAHGLESTADAAIRQWFSPAFLVQPEGMKKMAALRAMLQKANPEVYVAACQSLVDADFASSNAHIACPTLVVAGTHDQNISLQSAEVLCRSISGARLQTLDTGRMSAVECPEEFAKLVHEFIQTS